MRRIVPSYGAEPGYGTGSDGSASDDSFQQLHREVQLAKSRRRCSTSSYGSCSDGGSLASGSRSLATWRSLSAGR